MKKVIGLSLGLCSLVVGAGVVLAQESGPGTDSPPKVLVIQREFLRWRRLCMRDPAQCQEKHAGRNPGQQCGVHFRPLYQN